MVLGTALIISSAKMPASSLAPGFPLLAQHVYLLDSAWGMTVTLPEQPGGKMVIFSFLFLENIFCLFTVFKNPQGGFFFFLLLSSLALVQVKMFKQTHFFFHSCEKYYASEIYYYSIVSHTLV